MAQIYYQEEKHDAHSMHCIGGGEVHMEMEMLDV
jgi:hypothetical protein